MFAIIGEATSDVDTLAELVRRLKGKPNLALRKKGFNGCAEMFIKSPKYIKLLKDLGCNKFIICYDSDESCAKQRKQDVIDRIITPSGVNGIFCALVPTQELEAWILADLNAISKVISTFQPLREIQSPELIASPKEFLEKLSRKNARPLYSHAIHNSKVAKYLDLTKVENKCPSFKPLVALVTRNQGNI